MKKLLSFLGTGEYSVCQYQYKELAAQLDAFTQSMQTCRGPLLLEEISKLKERLQQAKEVDTLPLRPLAQVFDEVQRRVDVFSGDPVMLGWEAAEWCLNHGLIQQGFTF